MSDGYMQPYESINSSAKLIRLPKSSQRSRSLGRQFWTRFLKQNNSLSPTSSNNTNLRRPESPSSSSCRSQDFNPTFIAHHDSHRSSRSSSRASQSNSSRPMPKPRTSLTRNSVSGSENTTSLNDSFCLDNNKLSKTKTTVTVHLSKASKISSTPNLAEVTESGKIMAHGIKGSTESQSRSIKNPRKSVSVNNLAEAHLSRNLQGPTNHKFLLTQESNNNLQLNSLQVFRQPKYKDRKKAERKIKQLEHLKQSDHCNELVTQLSKGMHPNMYENQNTLKLVQFVNEEGFVTSSKSGTPVIKHSPKRSSTPPTPKRNTLTQDHVYTEINEDELKFSPKKDIVKTPILRKKVTFSTFHEPVLESDPFSQNKKILPAKFWGIVQVTQALRSRTDGERRRVAELCYHAIVSGAEDNSLKFLGKVDNSRYGDCVYVVLEKSSFEIRDGEGLVIVKHGFSDISVVTQIEDDPCLFVYVGRCKFNGRIGITIRFTKSKHATLVLSSFSKDNRDLQRL